MAIELALIFVLSLFRDRNQCKMEIEPIKADFAKDKDRVST